MVFANECDAEKVEKVSNNYYVKKEEEEETGKEFIFINNHQELLSLIKTENENERVINCLLKNDRMDELLYKLVHSGIYQSEPGIPR